MATTHKTSPEEVEEVQGLVDGRGAKEEPSTSSGKASSAKHQIILLYLGTSIFMLLVGFVFGKEYVGGGGSARAEPPTTLDKITKPTDMLATPSPSVKEEEIIPGIVVDSARLESVKAKALEKIKLLEEYWGEYSQAVLSGNAGLVFGFGKDGKPSNPASFNRNVDIIARVLVHQEALTLGFIGSSVMCGHDNCYYDSFPEQLRRFIGPLFEEATGKPVEIRNACQGGTCGDSYENQIFCFRHMVGDDIDFLFYEWTYFENGQAYIYHESVARWATLLPKVPATIIINCDGNAWDNKELPQRYAKFGVNGINLEQGLKAGPYKGKVWGAIGDGVHETTRYGNDKDVSETRKKSLGVVFRNWHPGPLGLQYVSDLTSYLFLRATVQAIDRIKTAPVSDLAKTWPQEPFGVGELPDPSFSSATKPEMYDLAQLREEPPGCYTIQRSTFGKPQPVIADRADDRLNPYKDVVKKLGSGQEAWSVYNAPPNWAMVPRDERAMGDMCRPPDNCAYFMEPTKNAATPLVFRLPKMTIGLIAICGGTGDAGKTFLKERDTFKVEFDGKLLDPSLSQVFPHTKCLAVQMKFTGPVDNKTGHLYLSITTTKAMRISQIITA